MKSALRAFIDRFFIKKPKIRRLITICLERNICSEVEIAGVPLTIHHVKEHGYLRASRMSASSCNLSDEIPVLINLAAILGKGADAFIDVGANVGLYSSVLARFQSIFPHIEYHAFEPNPDTFKRLQINADRNKFQAHQIAISSSSEFKNFVYGAVSHVFTDLENVSSYSIPEEQVEVECRRLDSYFFRGKSMILKIDVEGQELDVLLGAESLFTANRISAVYIDGYKSSDVIQFLLAHGFRLHDGKTMKEVRDGVFNLLAIKESFYEQ